MSGATFGEWLRQQLVLREMSQSELARRMETSHTTISNWISGKRVPTTGSCDRISDVFHIPLDTVLTKAGHRVEMPSEWPADVAEVAETMRLLPEPHRQEVLAFVRWRLQRSKQDAQDR